jgi:hypothetical protein
LLAQHELDDQELIGVVVSENLYRGEIGYCLVVTRHAITGAKKPESLGEFEAYLGPGSNITDAARAEAKKIAERLIGIREFSVPAGSIGQILFKKPGMFFGGYVIIKTGLSSFRIDTRLLSVGGLDLVEASDTLEDSLWMVVGERLCNMGKNI